MAKVSRTNHRLPCSGGTVEKVTIMTDFVWDNSKADYYEGDESKKMIQAMFMRAADDAPDIDTAVRLLRAVGR